MSITLPDGTAGYGASVKYSSDGSTYTTVADVQDIDLEGLKIDSLDTTTNSSTSGVRTFTPGLQDNGNLKFKALYTTTSYAALVGLYRTVYQWKVTFADTHTAIFQGFVDAMPMVVHMDEVQVVDVSVKISGVITYS